MPLKHTSSLTEGDTGSEDCRTSRDHRRNSSTKSHVHFDSELEESFSVRRTSTVLSSASPGEVCSAEVDLGILKQHHEYEAPVLDVERGSTLCDVSSTTQMLRLVISSRAISDEHEDRSGDSSSRVAVCCEATAAGPLEGDLAALTRAPSGALQRVQVHVVAQVMPLDKGTPMTHPDVVCTGTLPHSESEAEGDPLRHPPASNDGAE